MEPESFNLLSVQSHAQTRRNRGAPPRPKSRAATEKDQRRALAESRAMARVYCAWTGVDRAPWSDKQFAPSKLERRRNAKAKRRRRVTLQKLHNDTAAALTRAGRRSKQEILPYSGDTQSILKKRRRDGPEAAPLRLMVVFWAPGAVAAKRRSISVENTSEHAMLQLLRCALKNRATAPVLVDITYVLPRWKRRGPGGDHFASTPPPDLAYGIWRLGMHAALTRPDAVLSASIDVARVLEHSSGLDPTAFLSEQTKAAAAQLPILDMDPSTLTALPRLAPITRRVRGAEALQFPPSNQFAPTRDGVPHCRVPHPYLMSSDGVHKDVRKQHQFILFRAMEYLCVHVTPGLHRQRPPAEPQAAKRARVALETETSPADARQPVLVLREQQPPAPE